MNRKDTILVAVVINAGLLAVLFATAIISDDEKVLDQTSLNASMAEAKPVEHVEEIAPLIAAANPTGDEVDNVLFTQPSQPLTVDTTTPEMFSEAQPEEEEKPTAPQESFVEVTVKKGDVLEKIAKANGTTVNAIKTANLLKSEKLNIGQVLKVPVNTVKATKKEKAAEIASVDGVYHVVKSGDSPWKIAKQYSVNYEDILRLNKMDEERARNLKIGEKIRVK